eukprot:scaffold1000_cov166-Amphora_coffeaeformis.AAC.37
MAIFCCASRATADLEETWSTLKFTSSAKRIKINPTVHEVIPNVIEWYSSRRSIWPYGRSSAEEDFREKSVLDDADPPLTIPVWYYAVVIILVALEMNRALLLLLMVLMLSQSFDWTKTSKCKVHLSRASFQINLQRSTDNSINPVAVESTNGWRWSERMRMMKIVLVDRTANVLLDLGGFADPTSFWAAFASSPKRETSLPCTISLGHAKAFS